MSTPSPVNVVSRVTDDCVEVSVKVPLPQSRTAKTATKATHNADFSCVNWKSEVFAFGPLQRAVVAALWRAREQNHEWVSQETLLTVAESEGGRLRDMFRRHPAWGTMIVPAVDIGGPPGSYRLAEPDGGQSS